MSLQNNTRLSLSDLNSTVRFTAGNLGIGTTAPAYKLDVAGNVNFTGSLFQNGTPFSAGGGGSTSPSAWSTGGSSSIFYTSGNVGIGTTAPQAALHVSGGALIGTNIEKTDYARLNTSANYAIPPAASGTVNGVNITALNRRTRASNRTQDLSIGTWVSRTLPSSGSWRSVCWAAELGIFCAIMFSSTVAATSPDGITWTQRTLPASRDWQSVCWAAELGTFCAVASGGTTAATSPDGITWTSRNLPSSGNWLSVCWAAELGLFCAVRHGSGTNAATSPDGITWTQRTLPSSQNWQSVCWAAELGLFCTVAQFSSVAATSVDGVNWTQRTLPVSSNWGSVCWAGELGLFCAVSTSTGTIATTSPDGITWVSRTLPSSQVWGGVCWAAELGLFCAVSTTNIAATSPDGITWTQRTLPVSTSWWGVCWAAELGVFCTVSYSTATIAATSTPALPMSMNTVKAPASQFNINTDGNIAIGTTSPSANRRLTISGVGVSSGNLVQMEITNLSFTTGNLRLGISNIGGAVMTNAITGGGVICNDRGPLQFGTGSSGTASSRVIIATNGNVGVNTGNSTANFTLDVGGGGGFSGIPTVRILSSGNGDGATVRMENTSARTYIVGSVVNSTAGGTGFSIWDLDASASRMLISTNGNVGLGTTAPAFNLDVVGTARISTSITTGSVFSTNATVNNILSTNITSSNIRATTVSCGTINATDATIGTFSATNTSMTNLVPTNISVGAVIATTLSSGTIVASTFTGGSLFLSGNLTVAGTTTTVNVTTQNRIDVNITSSNVVSNSYSGGNMALSGTLSCINSTISNSVVTNLSAGAITSTTYSGGSLNVSDSINAVNGTITNIVATNITSGTLTVNNFVITSASVSISNIFTTGGNVGINTTVPQATLHVSGGNILVGSAITKTDYTRIGTNGSYALPPVASGTINGVNITTLNRRIRVSNGTQDRSVGTWISRTLSSSTNWNSVVWSPERGLFCAVSSSSGTIAATSPDGITWTSRTLPSTSTWYSVVWAAELGIFCAVGGTTAAATSTNGTTWTSRTLPTSGNWTSVVWAPELNLFCAVRSNSSAAATSPDGTTWTARTLPSSSNWSSVTWSPELGLFCAVSSTSGTVAATSQDGITWTARTLSATGTWTSVTWSPELGLFCAVSNTSGTTASTSPDGITWTTRTLPATGNWQSVTWAPELSLFCAVSSASGTVAATSADGIVWTSRTLPATASWQAITWSAELATFCVVATGSALAATSLMTIPAALNTIKAPASQMSTDTAGNLTITTSIRATNNSNTVGNIFTTGGNVGIGTTSPGYLLELSTDSAAKPSTNTWTVSSDSRLKTDITLANLETCYNNVKALPLKRYTWRDDVYTPEQVPDRSKLGWIAQDVETVIPKAVEQREQHGLPDCRSLNSDQIIASLYGCVQHIIHKVEVLETDIEELKQNIN